MRDGRPPAPPAPPGPFSLPVAVGRALAQLDVREEEHDEEAHDHDAGSDEEHEVHRLGEAHEERLGEPLVEAVEERAVLEHAAGRAGAATGLGGLELVRDGGVRRVGQGGLEVGVGTAARRADWIFSPAVENRIDRKTAVPSAPPICRVKVAVDVATPICCWGTAFCTARVSGWKLKPRPMPKASMTIIVCHNGVSYST